jgi:hypothetical protein
MELLPSATDGGSAIQSSIAPRSEFSSP